MKATRSTHPQFKSGPITTYEGLVELRAEHEEALAIATNAADRRYRKGGIASLDEIMKSLKTKKTKTKNPAATPLCEIDTLTDRERVMANLARKIGRGCDVIYHGTRRLPLVLRFGKLMPPMNGETAIFLSRSPETAAYFASLLGYEADRLSAGILVLNRRSLTQSYRLDLSRYDEDSDRDEREEVIWGRIVNVRRHLLGVVRESDVTAILGPAKHRYLPSKYLSWPRAKRSAFHREQRKAGDKLVRDGRASVRDLIVRERKQRSAENARLQVAPAPVLGQRAIKPPKKARRRRRSK